jgi:pyruvate ferredoxin oxidoreductase beta subunit
VTPPPDRPPGPAGPVGPTGRLTAGDRLADPDQSALQAQAGRPSTLTRGHHACRGCAEALAARWVVDAAWQATGGRLMVVTATGCLEVVTSLYPRSAWRVPWLHSLFGNAPAVAAGLTAANRARGLGDVRVLAQGGDGATADFGLAALSGLFERDDDVLYVCYDNQAYMNTGAQRSGATPLAAATATTPAVGDAVWSSSGGNRTPGKDMPAIAMAHRIAYVATATVADPRDVEAKVARAMALRGARYLHILTPCPPGWSIDPAAGVEMARLAWRCGLFPLFEAERGEITGVTPISGRLPVESYLRRQGRFAHIFDQADQGGQADQGDRGEGWRRDPALARLRSLAESNIARFGLAGEPEEAAGAESAGPADGIGGGP